MLTRHIEDTINNTLKDYPITLVTGPRQIGKSTLLYNKFIAKGYTYISLDDSLELAMAKSDPRTFLEIHSHPLIIDEAQKSPGLFVELERIVNESRLKNGNNQTNGMFILTGSQRTKLLEPYNETSIVKRVIKRPKLYFFDTGLAAYLCGIDSAPTLQRSFLKGRFFENFVINEIRKSFINFGIKQSLYYYRDTDQNEIDLVFIRNGFIYCIEVKTGQSFNASSTKAFKKLDNTNFIRGKNAIVCSASSVSILADGIYIIPVISI